LLQETGFGAGNFEFANTWLASICNRSELVLCQTYPGASTENRIKKNKNENRNQEANQFMNDACVYKTPTLEKA
jgi:hypothetical protein